MSSLRRFAVPAILLVALAAACTGDGGEPTPSDSRSPEASSSPTAAVPTEFTPGRFRYQNAGLDVELQLEANTGTMEVVNDSGFELGKPDLYVLDGVSGRRIDGKILDARPIQDGSQASMQVEFPPEVTPKSLGLVILLFGSDNYGAFAPA